MRKALYILADLEDEDIIWMSRAGSVREIGAGETLIHAGSPLSHLYFVTEGALEVVTRAGARIAELGLGEVVGEMSFVEKRVPSVSVRAVRPTRLLAIPREAMLAAFAEDKGLAMRFYRALAVFLSDRLRAMSDHDDGELDEGLLDNVQQAGERFIRLVNMSNAPAQLMR